MSVTDFHAFSVFQPLDYENKRTYILKVEATNIRTEPGINPPFKDTATVKIAVEDSDEPPVFSKPMYLLEVNENAPINTVIGTVTARDPDSFGSLVRWGVVNSEQLSELLAFTAQPFATDSPQEWGKSHRMIKKKTLN